MPGQPTAAGGLGQQYPTGTAIPTLAAGDHDNQGRKSWLGRHFRAFKASESLQDYPR